MTSKRRGAGDDIGYSYITLYESDLTWAASEGTITQKQANTLWPQLEGRAEQRFASTLTWLAYYTGAIFIITSMIWFTSVAYNDAHSLALVYLAAAYFSSFLYAANYFWNQSSTTYGKIVGGIFATIAASVSPVVTYGILRYINYDYGDYPGLPEQVTVILTGLICLYLIPTPLLTAPISIGFWIFSETSLNTLIYGINPTPAQACLVSIVFGFSELLFGYIVQRMNTKHDFSFFIYTFGLVSFCGGLSYDYYEVYTTSQTFAWSFFAVNVVLMILAVPLNRILFLVFGGAGFAGFIVRELFLYGTLASNGWFSVVSGGLLAVAAYIVDRKDENSDFPFWAYLFGVGTLECGLSFLFGYPVYTSQWFKLFYCVANIGIALLYIPTQRDIFIFAGSIGVLWYAQELVMEYAPDYGLPILLTVLGLALIALAVYLSTRKWVMDRRARRQAAINAAEQEL